MPTGGKPKGSQPLPVAEVARRLRVEPSQVEGWLQKDQLRGGEAGIRPYDFKKFQLDFPEEIKRAQQEAVQEKTNKTKQKPKKGLLSKFKSIFGGGKEEEGGGEGQLAKENQRLKAELQKLQKNKSPGKGSSREMEEKIRFLEKQASESRALEAEVASLKRQLTDQPSHQTPLAGAGDESLQREVDEMRRELAEARRVSEQSERFREALRAAQQERDELLATIENLRQMGPGESVDGASNEELQRLQQTVAERERALTELEHRAHQVFQENEHLRQMAEESRQAQSQTQESPLVEELLALQKINLARFKRLHQLHLQAQEQAGSSGDQQELEALRSKYEALLKNQGNGEEQKDLFEKLSESRVFISKLKDQNQSLKQQLQSGSAEESSRVEELEAKLREALRSGSDQQQMESELNSLRKAMESKENQIQKVASRLSDNEKRLAKAMQESARLTELLIERENRLREVSEEYEQEYRDKLENLDRQVSGLQWKLSLREERIAHLESELQRKG
ncbi:MAG: hypothetical protein KC800_06020 [Candidatus Eremiobacteraeota bacterium]|nr:hypothetical protein [Candidatus Eremiobacteraeota bacterium]